MNSNTQVIPFINMYTTQIATYFPTILNIWHMINEEY